MLERVCGEQENIFFFSFTSSFVFLYSLVYFKVFFLSILYSAAFRQKIYLLREEKKKMFYFFFPLCGKRNTLSVSKNSVMGVYKTDEVENDGRNVFNQKLSLKRDIGNLCVYFFFSSMGWVVIFLNKGGSGVIDISAEENGVSKVCRNLFLRVVDSDFPSLQLW